MLFERIRRTQKPVFIFLAVMFGLGFVLLGVGSGAGGVNIGDFFSGSSSSGPSTSGLRDKVAKNPNDASSWLKLAQAYQADGRTGAAIDAWQHYVALRPKDDLQISALAGLVEQQASQTAARAQAYQQLAAGPQSIGSATAVSSLKLGSGVDQPLATAAATPYQNKAQVYQGQATSDYARAAALRKQAAALQPGNPNYQFALASDALSSQDYSTAVKALKRYLKLAPDAPNASQIRTVIKQLAAFTKAQSQQQPTP
jgi:cytochrome c-type biogenesis protein CcmH/NrfG